jgi:hypothetical protein
MSATNRGATRNQRDFYATPESAFKPLIPYLPKDLSYWEPACGDGRLIRLMREAGLAADGADLEPAIEGFPKIDFLKDETLRDCTITNPPFSLAHEFCDHAIKHSLHTFMLLRLNFLASVKRRDWFKENEPAAIFVLSKRPSFTGNGKTDATDYAWIYWHSILQGISPKEHKGIAYRGIYHL